MPNRRFDWHEHIKEIEGEYRAARLAVDRLTCQIIADPSLLVSMTRYAHFSAIRTGISKGHTWSGFSPPSRRRFARTTARHNDPNCDQVAAVLIDSIGGRRGQGISTADREGAHAVRLLRNYWAHEIEIMPAPLTLAEARRRLQKYLSWLPEEWG